MTDDADWVRLLEERDVLKQERRALRKQRTALVNRLRAQQGELLFLKEQRDELRAMCQGQQPNEEDDLDLRYKDDDYQRRHRVERMLKQTKLLNVPPNRRIATIDTEGPDDLD